MVSNTRNAVVGMLMGAASAMTVSNSTAGIVYTTEVLTAITTYCPAPTTLTHGSSTYTVTEPTTLTITDCPCTVSKPVEPTHVPGDECSKDCVAAYRKCQGAPGANRAFCASEIASCLGYNPFDNSGSFVTPTACSDAPEPTATGTNDCASDCVEEYNHCRVAPHANMATCAAKLAGCVGYNPFNNGTFVTPTACSESDEPHYTTEVVTHLTTVCPSPTTLTIDSKTYTVTEPTTLTISDCSCTVSKPVEPTHTPEHEDTCAGMCVDAYNKCRVGPNANQATCAAELAGCVGYNPFDNNGSFVTPTACSEVHQPTSGAHKPTTNNGGSPPAQPTKDTPAQPSQGPKGDCPAECVAAYRECQGAPDANQSTCAAQISECLGYAPYDNSGSFVTPTACSGVPHQTTGQPSATMPGNPNMPSNIPEGAAGHLSPVKALGVIAAIALL